MKYLHLAGEIGVLISGALAVIWLVVGLLMLLQRI